MASSIPPPDKADYGHPSTDTSHRHKTDVYLRQHGFKIHSRPENLDPTWERHGKLYSQTDAILCVPKLRGGG